LYIGDTQPKSKGFVTGKKSAGGPVSPRPSAVGPGRVVSLPGVIRLDAATVLLQWSVGGLAFLWFTTRRREVGIGYGWLLRSIYLAMATAAAAIGATFGVVWVREISAAAVAIAALFALVVSVVHRHPGVSGRQFPPVVDLFAPILGIAGLVAAAVDAGGNVTVSLLRTIAGAAFLGSVTDAMLLGHWYLVQPGLPRRHLNELVQAVGWVWPAEVAALLLPTGMFSVWTGAVDDGWNGTLGWFWGACAVTTIVLVFVTKAALRERYYSAVMAATGLLYLAILTAFGTDLVARAVLAG
jgi:hypothetical protein